MLINGYDHRFFYSVGAFLALTDLRFEQNTTAGNTRFYIAAAVIMSKAFEDAEAAKNPNHTPKYLAKEEIEMLSLGEMVQLKKEIDAALVADSRRTVETEQSQKKTKKKALNLVKRGFAILARGLGGHTRKH